MAETLTLKATKRELTGKQVKQLRNKGQIPAVVYGPGYETVPVAVDWAELRPTLLKAGGTQLINLNVDGEAYNVLVRSVQRRPVRGDVLHLDFYRVRMDVAVRTEIPIVTVGEISEALKEAGGAIHLERNAVLVEALPGDLPHAIEVDISTLQEVGVSVTVGDLPVLEGVTYLVEPEDVVLTSIYAETPVAVEEEEEEETFDEGVEPELVRRREEEEDEEE